MIIYHWDSQKLSKIYVYDHRGSLLDMTRMYGYLQDLEMHKIHFSVLERTIHLGHISIYVRKLLQIERILFNEHISLGFAEIV